ncbi:hypothetical protein [Wenxinia saemankumensis]|uniref:Uncharacterized protein n=1 Tax=Wenxinia saemankumensis TaxID=1447782 RepID=A0A1M6FYB7_9RHOB|nr:hypothetical protein [Wenxinia saemankumensis]SHJ02650.1 hypothetical protein SAMN05444417_2568 [Wenxinia saemankumensis]
MADFLRPEARAALWRWREAIAAGGVIALGLWFALGFAGLLSWVGWAVILAGAALAVSAVQRLRFAGGGGMGVVEVVEAQVTYYGPLGGGTAELGDLQRLDIDRDAKPAHWWLAGPGGATLAIPVDAEGQGALFDALATLPGLTPSQLIEARSGTAPGRHVVWQRTRPALAQLRPAPARH